MTARTKVPAPRRGHQPAGDSPSLVGALARHVTLRQLQVFEAVARHRSFTRAADELLLAQPTVSMQVKKLADALGLRVFDQAGIAVKLTDAGKELYSACREVFDALNNLEARVADVQGLRRGRLRLAVIQTAKYLAPHLLGQFSIQHPGLEFSLEVANREQLLERFARHEDDVYIFGQPPADIDVDAFPLVPNPLVVMASRDHPLVGVAGIPLVRLLDEPFILREPGSGTRAAMMRLFESKKLRHPTARMEFTSDEAIKQAIVAGLGITVLSLHALVLDGTSGPIAILDVEGFPIQRYWNVISPRQRRPSIVAQAFIKFVKQQGDQIGIGFDAEMRALRNLRDKKKRDKPSGRG